MTSNTKKPMSAAGMKLVKTLQKFHDPWFGNNLVQIFEDKDGRFWQATNNDAFPKDHPDYRRIEYEVKKVTRTSIEWVEK